MVTKSKYAISLRIINNNLPGGMGKRGFTKPRYSTKTEAIKALEKWKERPETYYNPRIVKLK